MKRPHDEAINERGGGENGGGSEPIDKKPRATPAPATKNPNPKNKWTRAQLRQLWKAMDMKPACREKWRSVSRKLEKFVDGLAEE
ncbi:uncharacterized protein LOC62_06G008171 [Vanrija pseudolonga]|uniref:Uncharacterized protein n=1 Tax=Vanrija pseudolonga TaxID=143232 RepID=A0AAF0YIM0_9TREE|nr:hypothetical protein LOC62_06G008171 [Vanrija pseudolonga]